MRGFSCRRPPRPARYAKGWDGTAELMQRRPRPPPSPAPGSPALASPPPSHPQSPGVGGRRAEEPGGSVRAGVPGVGEEGGDTPCPGAEGVRSVLQDIDLIDILWRQDIDLGAGREIFDYSHRQKESEVDKERSDGRERGDGWRNAGSEVLDRNLLVDGETGESFPAQVTAPGRGLRPPPCSWRVAPRVTRPRGFAERWDKGLPGWASRLDAGKARAGCRAGEPQRGGQGSGHVTLSRAVG